ncbi:GNAT family N-acetyltransferase [Antribacter gilvus]|uniref:GNAT family N-acetyltransferase n=1 Tax=Antribacter gilvus TaxID=2304675 RepID=UPI000F798ECE|nr:GNAT family N-acetyltransferase [Antribacter gilvus]
MHLDPTETPPHLRRAVAVDAPRIAEIYLRSFAAALPGVRRTHSDDEVRAWFGDIVVPAGRTWVAVADDLVAGFLVLDDGWIAQLYLDPDRRGHGIGDRFVDLAKAEHPGGLSLWTFQANWPARRFYERHGFVPVEHTDGRGNEEREPDVRYAWDPHPWTRLARG